MKNEMTEFDNIKHNWMPCINCKDISKLCKQIRCYPSFCPICGRPLTEEAWTLIRSIFNVDDLAGGKCEKD